MARNLLVRLSWWTAIDLAGRRGPGCAPVSARLLARASVIAAIVGTMIVMINHGDHIAQEPICPHLCLKAALSLLTPFLVSLVSSMLAARDAVTDRRAPRQ